MKTTANSDMRKKSSIVSVQEIVEKHHLSRSQIKLLLNTNTLTEILGGHWEGRQFYPEEKVKYIRFL